MVRLPRRKISRRKDETSLMFPSDPVFSCCSGVRKTRWRMLVLVRRNVCGIRGMESVLLGFMKIILAAKRQQARAKNGQLDTKTESTARIVIVLQDMRADAPTEVVGRPDQGRLRRSHSPSLFRHYGRAQLDRLFDISSLSLTTQYFGSCR